MDSSRRERVFVVRMWATNSASQPGWRGSVQDVAERRTFYVGAPREVADYLAMALAREPEPADPGMDKPPRR